MLSKKYLFFLIIISLGGSQLISTQNILHRDKMDDVNYLIKKNHYSPKDIKGSPFLNDKFESVKLKEFGDRIFAARFDANLGEMQITRTNDTIILNNTEDFEVTFISTNKVYKTYNYTNKQGVLKRSFLNVLKEYDSLAVLKEEEIKFYDKKPSTSSYDEDKPAEYRRTKDVYYYRLGSETTILPQKRNDFLKLFPKHSNKLKDFMKDNRTKLNDDKDLIALFEYLEGL